MTQTVLFASALVWVSLTSGGEKTKLTHKFTEGTTASTQATTKVRQILTIAGKDIETGQESRSTISSTVGKRAANGRLPIHQKVETLSVQLTAPNVNLSFDSNNPNTQNDNPALQTVLETLRARVGSGHTIVLDKDNKVVAIEGAEKILEKATPAAAALLRRDIDPEKMRKSIEQSYGILPNEPVGEGDTWMRSLVNRVGGGQTITFETRFEYQGLVEKDGRKLHKIAVTSVSVAYAQDDPQAQLKVTQSNLKVESSKGVILFDSEKGRAVENTSVNRITGDLSVSINGMDFPGRLDLTFEVNNVVQK